jgi:colanic acid/amylovoran biosynthesis glycosyltransferase
MKRIAYLLHRFPGITDTFIRREIRSLQKAGTEVQIISVWKPRESETTPEILKEWCDQTNFLLPQSFVSIARILFISALLSPGRFLSGLHLAAVTSQPGLRGFTYQSFYFVEAVLAAATLKKSNIRHVHNHFGDHSGIVTMLTAKLAGITYSISFHGPHVFLDGKYGRIKEKVCGAHFTRSISYFCRSQLILLSEYADLSSFKVIHCGLDLSKYEFRPPRKAVERIFCSARLSSEKGLEFLLQALKLLLELNYNIELRLAGDGPSRIKLEAMAQNLKINDSVHFLGYLSEEQVTRELQSADLFVLSSLAEGLPISAMEAMAVGVPVVATNIAGTSELVEHGKTGILVRPSDAEALADAIVRMIEDHGFRLLAAELGRKKVVEEFDIDKESAKLNQNLMQSCD